MGGKETRDGKRKIETKVKRENWRRDTKFKRLEMEKAILVKEKGSGQNWREREEGSKIIG